MSITVTISGKNVAMATAFMTIGVVIGVFIGRNTAQTNYLDSSTTEPINAHSISQNNNSENNTKIEATRSKFIENQRKSVLLTQLKSLEQMRSTMLKEHKSASKQAPNDPSIKNMSEISPTKTIDEKIAELKKQLSPN